MFPSPGTRMHVGTETGHGETVCKIPTQENVSLFVNA